MNPRCGGLYFRPVCHDNASLLTLLSTLHAVLLIRFIIFKLLFPILPITELLTNCYPEPYHTVS